MKKWLSAAEVADRLKKVDVDRVTGFSLNVSNYNKTDSEVEYAESVRSELGKLGIADAHYVIDISRNGAGGQDDYCNAPGGAGSGMLRSCIRAVRSMAFCG